MSAAGQVAGTVAGMPRNGKLPVQTVPGQAYGQGKAQADAQRAVPMASAPAPAAPVMPAQMAGPAPTPPPAAGSLGDFARPTERPDEPLSYGLSTGPGPGPEAVMPDERRDFFDDPKTAQLVAMLERAVDLGVGSRQTRNMVRKFRANTVRVR